jgi:NADH:ubiquinone oxidoreductase subunit H
LIFVCAILAERRAKFRTLIRCTHQMALELRIIVVRYLILLVIVLVGVAFVTLIEQKILAGTQIRLGPNFVGY